MTSLGREVKPWVPCRRFTASKRTLKPKLEPLSKICRTFHALCRKRRWWPKMFKSVVKPNNNSIHAYVNKSLRSYVHACKNAKMYKCMHKYIHTCIYTHMQAHMYTRIHTYIHTHTQTHRLSSSYHHHHHHHQCSAHGQVFHCKLRLHGCSSAQRLVFHCKLRHHGCSSAQRQAFHRKVRNQGCSFTRVE